MPTKKVVVPSLEENIALDPLRQLAPVEVSEQDVASVYENLYSSIDEEDPLKNDKREYISALRDSYGNKASLDSYSTEEVLGTALKANKVLGFTDDITAQFSRDVRRLKGETIGANDVSEIFGTYNIPLPPLNGIDFSADDAEENIAGWTAKAKSFYNLKARTSSPELLAYRNEVFQKLDDTSTYLKRKANSTDSGVVDFIGRLGQGAATFADSLGLDDTAKFINNHVSTNPDWDDSISAIVGQGLGQAATFLGAASAAAGAAVIAAPALGIGAVGTAALGVGASLGVASRAAFHGTANERREKVLRDTGNEVLAEDATNTTGYYIEAGLDTVIDSLLVGGGLKTVGKIAGALVKGRQALKETLSEQLLKGSIKSAEKTSWLDTAVKGAGDIFSEGATEAIQGGIQDADINQLTNTSNYDALSLEDRAKDFIGGAAGGAFIVGSRSIIKASPDIVKPLQQGLFNKTEPLRNATANLNDTINASLASAKETFAPFVSDAVKNIRDSATPIVNTALEKTASAINKTNEALKPFMDSAIESGSDLTNRIYTSAKQYLGNKIQSPVVQQNLDSLGNLFTSFKANSEIESTKPAAAPSASTAISTGATTSTTATSNDSIINSSITTNDTPPIDALADKVSTGITASNKPDNKSLNLSTTSVNEDNVLDEKIPVVAKQETPALTPKELKRANADRRTAEGLEDTGLSRISLKPIKDDLSPEVNNFFDKATPTLVGRAFNANKGKGKDIEYLDSPDSFNDLKKAGLSDDAATAYIFRAKNTAKNTSLTIADKRLLNRQLQLDIIADTKPLDQLNNLIKGKKYSPKDRDKLVNYFNRTAGNSTSIAAPTLVAPTLSSEVNSDLRNSILRRRFGNLSDQKLQEIIDTANSDPRKKQFLDDFIEREVIRSGASSIDDVLNNLDNKDDLQQNKGAFKYKPKKSIFEVERVAQALNIPIKTGTLSDPLVPVTGTRAVGKYDATNGITLDPILFRSPQSVNVTMHEFGEHVLKSKAAKDLLNDPAIVKEAKDLSDSVRVTPTLDSKEQLVDAIAVYLDNPKSLQNQPLLLNALDNLKSKRFTKVKEAFVSEDAIPLNTKLAQAQIAAEKKYLQARESLATRNVDKRTASEKLRDIKNEFIQGVFNRSAPVQTVLNKLVKAIPTYERIAKSMGVIYEQFKNRSQTAQLPLLAINGFIKNKLIPAGITENTFDNYLQSNRIANELAIWEKSMLDNPTDTEEFQNFIVSLPIVKKLGVSLKTNFSEEFVDKLHELVTRAYAENKDVGLRSDIADAIKGAKANTEMLQVFLSAFTPDNVATSRQPTPQFFSKSDAEANLKRIRDSHTDEQNLVLDQGLDLIKRLNIDTITDYYQAGGLSDQNFKHYIDNASNYVAFQLADAITNDPQIDALIRNKSGSTDFIAGPSVTTGFKLGAIKANAAKLRYANQIAQLYALANMVSNSNGTTQIAKPLIPVATTGINYSGKKIPSLTKSEFFTGLKNGNFDKKGFTTLVTADKGEYIAHHIEDASIGKIFEGGGFNSDIGKAAVQAQLVARSLYTVWSPAFAAVSATRMSNRLFVADNSNGFKNKKLTFGNALKAFFTGPMMGIPLSAEHRNFIAQAWKLAGEYTSKGLDFDSRLDSLSATLPANLTPEQFLSNPEYLYALENEGLIITPLLGDIVSGLDPSESAKQGVSATQSVRDIYQLINGNKYETLFEKLAGSNVPDDQKKTSQKIASAILSRLDKLVTPIRNINTRLEFTEKIAGIAISLKNNGGKIADAAVSANFNFGNPDPREAGLIKAALSPFMLFATPALNGLRLSADTLSKGVSREDSRLLKATAVAFRNKITFSNAVLGAGIYALAMGLSGGDDEWATKQAEIAKKLSDKIPSGVKNSGMALPLAFRNPRDGNIIFTFELDSPDEVDPSWEAVYLQPKYDQTSAVFTAATGSFSDALTAGKGIPHAVAGAINAFSHSLPSYGPVANTIFSAKDLMQGRNPVDEFSGRPIISDQDFKAGGLTYSSAFIQNALHDMIPLLPDYSKAKASNKSKITDISVHPLRAIQALIANGTGLLKSTNYGDYENANKGVNTFKETVKQDIGKEASDKLVRLQEITFLAKELRAREKEKLLNAGVDPKKVKFKTLDLLPEVLKEEYTALNLWKKSVYDVTTTAMEMELRGNGKTVYYDSLNSSLQ